MRNDRLMPSFARSTKKNTLRALGALACSLLTPVVFAETDTEFADLAARTQYAYYTADKTALAQAVEQFRNLAAQASLLEMKQAYLAYGEWKLAELHMASDKETAAATADQCVTDAEQSLDAASGAAAAEIYAVQSLCLGLLTELRAVRSPLYARRRDKSLAEALRLAPGNPRVLLSQILTDRETSADAMTLDGARARLLKVIERFDAEASSRAKTPDWGFAEALLALGEVEMSRGDKQAARNALERALLLAPDYSRAKGLLENLSTR